MFEILSYSMIVSAYSMMFIMSMLKLPHITTTIHTINPTKKAKPEIRPAVLPAWALRHLGIFMVISMEI